MRRGRRVVRSAVCSASSRSSSAVRVGFGMMVIRQDLRLSFRKGGESNETETRSIPYVTEVDSRPMRASSRAPFRLGSRFRVSIMLYCFIIKIRYEPIQPRTG